MKEYGIRGILAIGFAIIIYCFIATMWSGNENKAVFSISFVFGWYLSKEWLSDTTTKNIK